MKILVISPHPDDEVLGVGGTMHRFATEGHQITVAIVTRGWSPLFPTEQVAQVRAEAEAANASLGVQAVRFMDLPVTKLHALPRHELNAAFDRLMIEEEPDWVFLPFPGDRHEDHRQVFDASLVALRPAADRPPADRVLCYETVSETHWAAPFVEPAFEPQTWVDITASLDAKLAAMATYVSQMRPAPDARSLEAVQALATWRGSVVGMSAAEVFTIVRECWPATRSAGAVRTAGTTQTEAGAKGTPRASER
jgi:LmbE family N-acetylglucosaminyl deacetylase